MKTLVISDLHLGVSRVGGTTAESAQALREYGHNQFRDLLFLAGAESCDRVIINGDLADQYNLPLMEALEIYGTMDQWLQQNPNKGVILACGNHDLSKDSSRLGTVEFVGALLKMKYPDRFTLVTQPEQFDDIYILPHVVNQDVFELELGRIPEGVKYLLLHSNYDNKFAADAEHSLNLDRAQAKAVTARGITIVMGHEHQGRESMAGKVVVVGNQFPSSVSDCMPHGDGQKNGTKRALVIENGAHRFVPTWSDDEADEGWFSRIDWRELKDVEEEGRGFVRVEGDASEAEAADVIKAISAFRQRSKSFVVANAVKVEQADSLDTVAASIEDIRNVSVLELLLEQLDDAQQHAVRKLMAFS